MTEDKKGLQQKKETQEAGNSTEIHCEINGKPVSIKKGSSIIEAFYPSYKDIAHYCWHPGLSVAGVCRLCMVEIQGQDRLQVACNTKVQEGMVISNQSDKVKNAVRWGMDFHLINHPLDCPICDQSGECGLQELYMRFGKYDPDMAERKVKKRKVVNLGEKIVLDTERCILCTRCVRFTEEVSKTHELGIFHRGDRSEIGVFKDKPLNNNYSLNTVDICPVGALTAKDFRFRQRVWYLKTADSICTGCSTGCNVKIDYNEEGLFRVQPRYNKEVNGYWMCDKGREMYRLPNKEERLLEAQIPSSYSFDKAKSLSHSRRSGNPVSSIEVLKKIKDLFVKREESGRSALVLTAQYTVEEYEDLVSFFVDYLGTAKDIYYWRNNPESFDDFDGLLLRGDKNPNTKGLLEVLTNQGAVNPWESLQNRLEQKEIRTLWVAGPENQKVYPSIREKIDTFESYCDDIIWWTAHPLFGSQKIWQIPTKTFFEKEGTFINHAGRSQRVKAIHSLVSSAFSLSESVTLLKGEELKKPEPSYLVTPMKTNHFTYKRKML